MGKEKKETIVDTKKFFNGGVGFAREKALKGISDLIDEGFEKDNASLDYMQGLIHAYRVVERIK